MYHAFRRRLAADGRQRMVGQVRREEHIVAADGAAKKGSAISAEQQAEGGKHAGVVAVKPVQFTAYVAVNVGDEKRVSLFEHILLRARHGGANRVRLRVQLDGGWRRLRHGFQTASCRSTSNAARPRSRA